MNNFDTGEKLLAEADLERVRMEYDKGRWNRTVRAAQKAVEHCLKGLLKMVGVEYPKQHDVGDVLEVACKSRDLGVPDESLQEIRRISASLADDRAPAFYFEEEYTQHQAEEAMFGAEKVLEFGRELAQRLR